MNQRLLIDVTKIEPKLKHPTIFSTFDGLEANEAILLHNDHDPKPLYYQLLSEKGNCFTWLYEQSGPEIWEVEIRKHAKGLQPETLGDIVAKDIRKAEVFKKFGLDFCCGGKKTLQQACKEKGLDVLLVESELKKPVELKSSLPTLKYDTWTCTFLVDYIINVHHANVRENMPIILDLANKVADHHGSTNPELLLIRNKFTDIVNELNVHMKKEEHILFPYLKQQEHSRENGDQAPSSFATVKSPISVMEQDHELVGTLFEDIKKLTNCFTLPANACNSYALLYKKLIEFGDDLHLHIHLENNILFPKAIELEKS